DEVQGSPEVNDEVPAVVTQASAQQKEPGSSGADPWCPTGRIPEAVRNKLQAEFERARANRFPADLEKAQAENVRLLALLQQAETKPKPKDFYCQTLNIFLASLRYILIFVIYCTKHFHCSFCHPLQHYD
ncbi:hypothetical protein Dimus_003005, partial [Dionaea muscipula]